MQRDKWSSFKSGIACVASISHHASPPRILLFPSLEVYLEELGKELKQAIKKMYRCVCAGDLNKLKEAITMI